MRKHHKEENSVWEISFRKSSVRGIIPRDNSIRGRSPRWKYTFSIDDKGGDIYQMQDRMLRETAQKHVDMGSIPRKVQLGGAAPKGDTLFH